MRASLVRGKRVPCLPFACEETMLACDHVPRLSSSRIARFASALAVGAALEPSTRASMAAAMVVKERILILRENVSDI